MVKMRRSRQPTRFSGDLSEAKAKAILAGKLDVPKIKQSNLPHERSLSRMLEGRRMFIPYESDEERKKRKSGLVRNLADNEKRLARLKAIPDPPPGRETEESLKRRIKMGKLQNIINNQIVKLQMMQGEELEREQTRKVRAERLAATMNQELVRLEKGKLIPKKKFRHQNEIDKVFGPSDLVKKKETKR